MDNPLQPPEDRHALENLLVHAKFFIRSLIGEIEDALPPGEGVLLSAPLVRLLMQRWMIPAEAALRRFILLLASTLTLAPRRVLARPDGSPAPAEDKPPAARKPAPRAPVFSMKEPQPRPKTGTPTEGPRLPRPQASPARPANPALAAAARTEKFLNRLDALVFAMADPVREAKRWLRRQARAHTETGAPAPLPLAFDTIPGLQKELGAEGIGLMQSLNAAALATLPPRPDTS